MKMFLQQKFSRFMVLMCMQVLNPLKELAKDISGERRKHLSTGADLNKSLKNQLDTLDRVRERERERGSYL